MQKGNMWLIPEVLVTLVLVFVVWWYKMTNKNKDFYKTIPGPPPLPIVGNAFQIKSTTHMIGFLMKCTERYGKIVKVQAGPFYKSVWVSDNKFLESILNCTKILTKTLEYDFISNWLGTGLLTSEPEKWKKHRRIITPAFHFQILEQFIQVFESNGDVLVEKLAKESGKSSVDIYPFITLCALDIISESAMGVKINAQKDPDSLYVRSVKDVCRIIIERTFSPLQMYNATYPLTRNYYVEKNALKILHHQTNKMINERREKLKTENKKSDDDDGIGRKRKLAFLDLLLQTSKDGRPLTQEEIREEVDTFMFEGHDTTASAMSFTIFCLANHPEVQVLCHINLNFSSRLPLFFMINNNLATIATSTLLIILQKKVFEEQKLIFGNDEDPRPTYADLQKMKYLEQVIKETMRLYSTVPFIGRKTTQPVELDGQLIPQNVTFIIFIYGFHHDPEYFKDPEKFDPDRFNSMDGTLPFPYIPFGAGPRNCIGQKFAMLEMKSTVSKIVRKFELSPASPRHELVLAFEATLKSYSGIKVGLKFRERV